MSGNFLRRYRNGSNRAQWWDYSNQALYFITICTNQRIHYFGKIENKIMCLSDLGTLAYDCWYQIPQHFSFVYLDEFIVMPDHIHGIIGIGDIEVDPICNTTSQVQPSDELSEKNQFMSNLSPKRGSIGSIIRSYKSAVSNQIHRTESAFKWQPLYYDRIIRTDSELINTRNYIQNNPGK